MNATDQKDGPRKEGSKKRSLVWRWGMRLGGAGVVLFVAGWVGLKFIAVPGALTVKPPQSLEIVDRAGRPLRHTSVGERFRREVSLAEIPRNIVQAMLAAEDKR